MELFSRGIRRRGFRGIGWSGAYALDDHALNKDRRDRHVTNVVRHSRNRFHDVHIFALSPDRVFSVERWIGASVIKKCESFVSAPPLAIARRPGVSNLSDGTISLL